jgi:hypothetical protein
MTRILAVVALLLALVSCDTPLFAPGVTPEPTLPPPATDSPNRPSPSIEIPPPVN